jgi:small subunit ribosomal protein S20
VHRFYRVASALTTRTGEIVGGAHTSEFFVAHHKDAIKRIRTSQAANERNRSNRTRMRGKVKQLRSLIDTGDHAAAAADLPATVALLQKLAQKGVIHPRNAARRISRLAKSINALKATPAE